MTLEFCLHTASYDGQAGAAAITLDSPSEALFMKELYSGLKKTGLPAYAMPRLIRITKEYFPPPLQPFPTIPVPPPVLTKKQNRSQRHIQEIQKRPNQEKLESP